MCLGLLIRIWTPRSADDIELSEFCSEFDFLTEVDVRLRDFSRDFSSSVSDEELSVVATISSVRFHRSFL